MCIAVLRSLMTLTDKRRGVGAHCVIDTDGTRYILCPPTAVTFHAGLSCLHGRESCNYFTVGVEFQGNTLRAPLTEEQVESGIEYLLPIIRQYHIPLSNIVTHEMVRTAYKERHPEVRCYGKVDITQVEYHRFMAALEERLAQEEAAEKARKAKASIGNGSISLAQIGSMPHRTEARGKPEMPSNRLPIVSFRVG